MPWLFHNCGSQPLA